MDQKEITFFDDNNAMYDIVDIKIFYKDSYSSIIYMWNDIIDYIKESKYSYDILSSDDYICIKLLREKTDVVGTKSEVVSYSSYEIGDDY